MVHLRGNQIATLVMVLIAQTYKERSLYMIRHLEMIMKLLMTKLQVTQNSITMKPLPKVALVLTSDSMKLRTV